MSEAKPSLTYRDAGVDIDAGNTLVERIKPHTQRTKRPEMISDIGGFGALFSLPSRYENPVLVSGTDGVGTKVKLAIRAGLYQRIGIDLVAMCVNDIVVCGAEPLFFLDYFATGKLDVDVAEAVVAGIADGCLQAGAALSGGETAEMPGFYNNHEFDLAGFCVGVVEKDKIIDRSRVQVGDVLIGLASSGPHSNGYSLIRKIVRASGAELDDACMGSTLAEVLLEPTRIYVKPLLAAYKEFNVHAVAHITGGGLLENIPRVMPPNTRAIISKGTWQRPKVFDWLQEHGNVAEDEMLRTFNCGIGMVVIAAKDEAEDLMSFFRLQGLDHWKIGEIDSTDKQQPFVEIID